MFKKILGIALVASLSMFMVSCDDEDPAWASIMFSWASSQQSKIDMISASYDDVLYWYNEIFADEDFDIFSMSDLPEFMGSKDLDDNIYSKQIPASAANNGVFFPIKEGKYTAICSGTDQYGEWDIFANYQIKVTDAPAIIGGGKYEWFEVAFDVASFLNDNTGEWFFDDFWRLNEPFEPEFYKARNAKTKIAKVGETKVFKKGNSTMELDYYYVRRAAKS